MLSKRSRKWSEGTEEGRQRLAGRFRHLHRARARRAHGRNPRTGQTIQIKASKNPAFKAGKAFKDALN